MRPFMNLFMTGHNLTDLGHSYIRVEGRIPHWNPSGPLSFTLGCRLHRRALVVSDSWMCLCVCELSCFPLQRAERQPCVGRPIVTVTDGSQPCVCLISITQADFLSWPLFLSPPLKSDSNGPAESASVWFADKGRWERVVRICSSTWFI